MGELLVNATSHMEIHHKFGKLKKIKKNNPQIIVQTLDHTNYK
jgi:hypothetical protein